MTTKYRGLIIEAKQYPSGDWRATAFSETNPQEVIAMSDPMECFDTEKECIDSCREAVDDFVNSGQTA